MRKLILFMVMFAITVGSGVASADKVYIPWIISYGNSDYTNVYVTNLSTAAVAITVTFSASASSLVKPSSMATNTLTDSTTATATVPGAYTWEILTKESGLFSSTTSMKRATISIQSSAGDDPQHGPIGAHAIFVHVPSSGDPSGFMFPVAYRVKVWNSVAASQVGVSTWGGGDSVNDWRQ